MIPQSAIFRQILYRASRFIHYASRTVCPKRFYYDFSPLLGIRYGKKTSHSKSRTNLDARYSIRQTQSKFTTSLIIGYQNYLHCGYGIRRVKQRLIFIGLVLPLFCPIQCALSLALLSQTSWKYWVVTTSPQNTLWYQYY